MLLIIIKGDLEGERVVTREMGQEMAEEFGGFPVFETSAKFYDSVYEV